jgi:2-polyprenyl-3-methyl-5-hydroxy-6-metoxy-1,4-benzoquinol methylase
MENLPRNGYLLALSDKNNEDANKYNVVPDIHCQDYIFNALHFFFKEDFNMACESYYRNGNISATKVRDLIDKHTQGTRVERILDFASGYGCVSRHFKNVMPNTSLTAMDIHENAYHFNKMHFGVDAIISSEEPVKASVPHLFDAVFALSFFSHMPDRTFSAWLEKLSSFVRLGGIVIFTTHGETTHNNVIKHIPVNNEGYGFIADSEQFDLSTESYGHAITYSKYVLNKIRTLSHIKLVESIPGDWWGHQDVFILKRV